jgi:hypothetical protein
VGNPLSALIPAPVRTKTRSVGVMGMVMIVNRESRIVERGDRAKK